MGDDKEDKHDLTLLTDIGEFLHELDSEVDSQLDHAPGSGLEEEDNEEPMEFNEFKVPTPGDEKKESDGDDSDDSLSFGDDSDGASFGEEEGFGEDSSEGFSDETTNFSDDTEEDSENDFSVSEGPGGDFDNSGFEEKSTFGNDANSESKEEPEESEEPEEEDLENAFSNDENDLSEDLVAKNEQAPSFDSEDDFNLKEEEENEGPKIIPLEVQKDKFGAHQEAQDIAPPSFSSESAEGGNISSPPENFSDVKDFATRMSYGVVAAGGNPPFSLILKNIKFKEDADDILRILKEHGLATDLNEEDYQKGLDTGSVIISQVSEYAAIILAHKFRRFDLDILVGLSEEIHPSNSYDNVERGLVSKSNLGQNKSETMEIENTLVDLNSIIVATTPNLENYEIHRYIGIVTEHKLISEEELEHLHQDELSGQEATGFREERIPMDLRNKLNEGLDYSLGLVEIYSQLSEKLKVQAHKLKGNAIVGVNFQLTPLLKSSSNREKGPEYTYKITCSGNVVFVSSGRTRSNEVTP